METPSFTFRLERVRTIRERAEDRAREALTVELRNRAEGEDLLRNADRRRRPPPATPGRSTVTERAHLRHRLHLRPGLPRAHRAPPGRGLARAGAPRGRGRRPPRGARRRGPRPPGDRQAQGAPEGRARRRMGAPLAEHARRARARRPPPGRRSHRMSIEAVMSRVSQLQAMLASAQGAARGAAPPPAEELLDRSSRTRPAPAPRPERGRAGRRRRARPRATSTGQRTSRRHALRRPRSPPPPRPTGSTRRCSPA